MNQTIGLSTDTVTTLMNVLSQKDGVIYTSFTFLRFSRPAVCLSSDCGTQRTVTLETAKDILRKFCNDGSNTRKSNY